MVKDAQGNKEAVKVAVRLRPMNDVEKKQGFSKVVEIDRGSAQVYIKNPQNQTLTFTFDFSFPEDSTQEEIYDATASPIVSGVLEGFNGTIFAYGQTGTGKTFSMDGKQNGELRGIMPRAFDHIFEYIAANAATHEFLVTVQYVEIYNDEIRDLLASTHDTPLRIREDPNNGVYVQGVAIHKVKDVDDLHNLLKLGKKNRVVRKTNMNAESSRSHSIFTITVETLTKIDGQNHVKKARLNLVDLAGSERAAKTGQDGIGFIEGVNINFELMILGNCISALTSRSVTHVPYRDSKLTMMLRDSLGGNARTMMIAAIGPADYNFSETMSTLRYAERAKKIENRPKVNMDPKDAIILKLKDELAELQQKLSQKDQLNAQMGASDDVIAAMEEKLKEQRAELAKASSSAQKEREELDKKLKERKKEIEREKAKREEYQKKLDELQAILSTSDRTALMAKTSKNENDIAAIREKLRLREERSKQLQKEVEERRKKQEEAAKQLSNLQQDFDSVNNEYQNAVSKYKNLKLYLPEIQKNIQSEREAIAENIEFLGQQVSLYNKIIDNFIPLNEIDAVKQNAVYDDSHNTWQLQQMDKKKIVMNVLAQGRPKSAIGAPRPTAAAPNLNASSHFPLKVHNEDNIESVPPAPVKSRLRKGPSIISIRQVERAVEAAFSEIEPDLTFDVKHDNTAQLINNVNRNSYVSPSVS